MKFNTVWAIFQKHPKYTNNEWELVSVHLTEAKSEFFSDKNVPRPGWETKLSTCILEEIL